MSPRKSLLVLFACSWAVVAHAECPNMCSGHGECHIADMCICTPNWRGADCSERVCPYGRAFVDTAQGDLNGDGVLSPPPARFITQEFPDGSLGTFELFPDFRKGEAHGYMECSNAGRCDRTSGTCRCFTGYAGHACQRTTCPSSCSGHGVCRTIEDMGQRYPIGYGTWDARAMRRCVCDPGHGGLDCNRGADPVTAAGGVDEVQLLNLAAENPGARGTFVLDFTDTFGFEWHTRAIEVDAGKPVTSAASVRGALLAIPNDAIVNVNVTGESAGNALQIKVTFTHTSGDVALLRVRDVQMMDGLGVPVTASVVELVKGTKLSAECSNRGLCDYMLGLCRCFKGFFTHDCSKQSALSR